MNDYCTRYGENITAICAEQDKQGARAMKDSPTAEVIHDVSFTLYSLWVTQLFWRGVGSAGQ